ncbi:MAG: EthD family reductase [Candidatus Rokubacteria bacterium]|nr:EthD family reductase [Candidatus Rokubacteria bacterium]
MVKVVTFLKRKTGMPVDEFQAYWRTRHPEVVTRLPGVRRYVQSHTLPAGYRKGEPIYDGIAEVWADDTDALRAMTRSPEYARVQADEANFIDRASMGYLVTEEHTIKEGSVSPGNIKNVEFLTRKPSMRVGDFQSYWREVHGAIAARIPALRRYVQSHTRRAAYDAGRAPAYDGLAVTWFDSTEAIRAAAATPEYAVAAADRARFLAPGPMRFILTTEHVIVG